MNEEFLKQMVSELKDIRQGISSMRSTMATKEDVAEIPALKEEIHQMQATMATKEEMHELKATVATKEDIAEIPAMKVAIFEILDLVKSIQFTQSRDRRILDILSRRSIEQEAEIKRIR